MIQVSPIPRTAAPAISRRTFLAQAATTAAAPLAAATFTADLSISRGEDVEKSFDNLNRVLLETHGAMGKAHNVELYRKAYKSIADAQAALIKTIKVCVDLPTKEQATKYSKILENYASITTEWQRRLDLNIGIKQGTAVKDIIPGSFTDLKGELSRTRLVTDSKDLKIRLAALNCRYQDNTIKGVDFDDVVSYWSEHPNTLSSGERVEAIKDLDLRYPGRDVNGMIENAIAKSPLFELTYDYYSQLVKKARQRAKPDELPGAIHAQRILEHDILTTRSILDSTLEQFDGRLASMGIKIEGGKVIIAAKALTVGERIGLEASRIVDNALR